MLDKNRFNENLFLPYINIKYRCHAVMCLHTNIFKHACNIEFTYYTKLRYIIYAFHAIASLLMSILNLRNKICQTH
jgi:hypothetical protein